MPPAGARPGRGWRAVAEAVSRVGDIVDMLKLPEGQTLFAPARSRRSTRCTTPTGAPCEPSDKGARPAARRQLHQRVHARADGLGRRARGSAPQLAPRARPRRRRASRRTTPAPSPRGRLLARRRSRRGEDRLAGKRVVIWEFASRELAVGDWKPIDWAALAGAGRRGDERAPRRSVTGAAGVMGPRLVRRLASRRAGGCAALVLPRRSAARAARRSRAARFVEGDIATPRRSRGACAGVDTVYHLAAVILARDPRDFDARQPRRHGPPGRARPRGRRAPLRLRLLGLGDLPAPHALRASPSWRPSVSSPASARSRTPSCGPTLVYDETGGQEFMLFLRYLQRFPVVPFIGPGTARKRPVCSDDVVDGLVRMAGNPVQLRQDLQLQRRRADHDARPRPADAASSTGAPRPFLHVPVPLLPRARAAAGASS